MRSVIRKPLTIFVMEENSAIAPRMRMGSGCSEPVTMMEPTTAIAEIALVMDIRGVCNKRDTRPITPIPINVDNKKTNTMDT